MDSFDYHFDKIFVLKSLGESDTYADDLYYETIEPYCKRNELATEAPIDIYDVSDWDNAIEKIFLDEHRYPLVHIEMHGNETEGLQLRMGDFIPWSKVIEDFTHINIRSGFNLIVTMAVCYSTMNTFSINMAKKPAPYLFSVTTRKEILGNDTYQMFTIFFKKLIETKDLFLALKFVELDHPELAKQFDILAMPFLFENTFKAYAERYSNPEVIKKGFYSALPDVQKRELTKAEFELYRNAFIKSYALKANKIYRKYRDIFFMVEHHPQNRERFTLPDSLF